MPTFDVTTKESKQVWASPDGQRKIYKVVLDVNGKDAKASTYSDKVAQVGFKGTVETYEKDGRYGVETYVKQVQNPNFGGSSSQRTSTASSNSTSSGRDDSHIRAQWAIGQAVNMSGPAPGAYGDYMDDVEHKATLLFHMVDRVKTSEMPKSEAEQVTDEIDAFIGGGEQVSLDDAPWGQ